MEITETLARQLTRLCGKELCECSERELYDALLNLTKTRQAAPSQEVPDRKLYYISAEFLVGKLLSCNLLNLGIYDEVQTILAGAGKDLSLVEEYEPEPSLGNGGLGRLAACFLDSIASLNLPGDGVGLNYHYGLFRQIFQDRTQAEIPDPWLDVQSWLTETGVRFSVPFGAFSLEAVEYTLDIPGYQNGRVNKLHLFDIPTPAPAPAQGISFDQRDIAQYLTAFLYPDDSNEAGRLLRVYQQYFMVSAAAQLILKEAAEFGWPLEELNRHVAVQINDTHPSMVIPELIRLLTERGLDLDRAISVVSEVCAYTNHTILAEALETWPSAFIEQVAPQLLPVIQELDRRVKARYDSPRVAIIDEGNRVHMAHMDIHYSRSVNGVAALHTQILKETELQPFYALYPGKFNNKTNGITFRRWLMTCNRPLSGLISRYIGEGWKRSPEELERLLEFRDEEALLQDLLTVKQETKADLARYLKATQGITLNPEGIFDIQVKRLHEYKRQQMNALYAIWKYFEIKRGILPSRPVTLIFGGKAAPAYTIAKDIIHLIVCLGQLIERDPDVSPWLRVVMVENYNVTLAQHLIPAADLSEQISLASKEASGTGNMKFMANGAVTLGTMDGANVEIAQLVGQENIYLFGARSDQVIALYETRGYRPQKYAQNPEIKPLLDWILSEPMLAIGDQTSLKRLHADLCGKDWFMALLDLEDYIKTKEQALSDYEDRLAWSRKMLTNIAKSGYFSSDRAIRDYNRDIWHL